MGGDIAAVSAQSVTGAVSARPGPEGKPTVPQPDQQSEDELSFAVGAARHGDERAFGVVYRLVQPGLLRYLRMLVGADAEDVASEAWLQIVRDLTSFSGDGNGFRRWAVTIGRNRAMDHLRRQQRRPAATVPFDMLVELAGTDDTAVSAVEALGTDAALALIGSLPPDQAEAVMLRAVVGLDAVSAAEVLGKRPGAVRTAAYRGLRRLAEVIERRPSGHE
jgi:RNA polymerase sigma-70 factor, ECF subfamily